MSNRRRPQRPQVVLEVIEVSQVAPHLVRVVAGGPGFADFEPNGQSDAYVKMLFADPALGLTPPYDLEELRERLPLEQLPVQRTYTVHSIDPDAGTLAIDFVTHGETGVAGPWASRAQPGDVVVFNGPGGAYTPDPDADWHLLVGDDAAIPAIAAAVAAMPADAVGTVLLEVDGDADHVELNQPAGVEVTWLHRDGATPGETSLLEPALRDLTWRAGRVHVFAHGEREAMKSLRPYLLTERAVPRADLSLSAYWAFGRTEEVFQAEKREPIGVVLPPA